MTQFGDEDLKTVLLGSIPKQEDLYCLIGILHSSPKNKTNLSNKAYQNQIFKCRCLIFSEVEVIASPVLGAVHKIHIIVSRQFYRSGKLQRHLDKLNIMAQDPLPVDNVVYELCLRYTVLARLAPLWNQVERYLVHGRDFLTSSSPLDAVKLDIVINDNDVHLVLWPLRMRLPQVCAQDLHQSFTYYPPSLVRDLSGHNVTVHVLPSLNLANVVMVSEHFLNDSIFKSYRDLKRYWKNSYGYRLPESEEGMVYLKVKLGLWSETLTYPLICVRARTPVFLRQNEPQMVLMRIIADLHARTPNICGFPFSINTTFRYAIPKLSPLTQVVYPSNLTETKPLTKKLKGMELSEESPPESPSQPVSQYPSTQASSWGENKIHNTSPPTYLPNTAPRMTYPTTSKPVFVPVFTPKPKSRPSPSTTYVPVFNLQPRTPSPSSTYRSLPASPSSTRDDSTFQEIVGQKPIRPMFGIAQLSPAASDIFQGCEPELNMNSSQSNQFVRFPLFNPSVSGHPSYRMKDERTLLHLTEPVSSKKMRNKPQVQDVDIRKLAQMREGLSKVNTTTLIAFLRQEGVPCRVKDKKGDLVIKVLTHLQLPVPGPSSQSHCPSE